MNSSGLLSVSPAQYILRDQSMLYLHQYRGLGKRDLCTAVECSPGRGIESMANVDVQIIYCWESWERKEQSPWPLRLSVL